MSPAEREATDAWKEAYERSDLVARMLGRALIDYRNNLAQYPDREAAARVMTLPPVIDSQLDRLALSIAIEEDQHAHMEQARGSK